MADDDDPGRGEDLDPRVEGTLQALNKATDDINTSENELEAAKKTFKAQLEKSKTAIAVVRKKAGTKTINKAKPYYDALFESHKSHIDITAAVLQYDHATQFLKECRQAIRDVETKVEKGAKFDEALQRSLNHAMEQMVVGEDRMKAASTNHIQKTKAFRDANEKLKTVIKGRKKAVAKAKTYFESKLQHERTLLGLKNRVLECDKAVSDAKSRVADSLRKLEQISSEIHQKREARKAEGLLSGSSSTSGLDMVHAKINSAAATTEAVDKRRAENSTELLVAQAIDETPSTEDEGDDEGDSDESEDTDISRLAHDFSAKLRETDDVTAAKKK